MSRKLKKTDIDPKDIVGKAIYRVLERRNKTSKRNILRFDHFLALHYKVANPNASTEDIVDYLASEGFPYSIHTVKFTWNDPSIVQLYDMVKTELFTTTDLTWKIPNLLSDSMDYLLKIMHTDIEDYEKLGYSSSGALARDKRNIAENFLFNMLPKRLDLNLTANQSDTTMQDIIKILQSSETPKELESGENNIIEGEFNETDD